MNTAKCENLSQNWINCHLKLTLLSNCWHSNLFNTWSSRLCLETDLKLNNFQKSLFSRVNMCWSLGISPKENLVLIIIYSGGNINRNKGGTPLFEKVVDQDNSLKNRIGLEIANLQEATKVIVENHYLHRGRTMGQIAYWVTLDGQRCGVLLFALPRLSVKFRGHGPMNLVELARPVWKRNNHQGCLCPLR